MTASRSAVRGLVALAERSVLWMVLAALAATVGLVSAPEPGEAACVGPTIRLDRDLVVPRERLVVMGESFGDDCNDTGRPGPSLGQPVRGITLQFRQGERTVVLATVDADDDYEFRKTVRIPRNALPGPAAIGGTTDQVDADAPFSFQEVPIVVGEAPRRPSGRTVQLALDDIPRGVSKRTLRGTPVFVVRQRKSVHVLLTDVHHLGGQRLKWCATPRYFRGTKHGETFAVDGVVIGGPARRGLDGFATSVVDGTVMIELDAKIRGEPRGTPTTATGRWAPRPGFGNGRCGPRLVQGT